MDIKIKAELRPCIINGKKKGKIEIEYYGSADLERICRILNIT